MLSLRGGVPETVVSEGIASKRNILRKGEVERRQPKEKFKGLAVRCARSLSWDFERASGWQVGGPNAKLSEGWCT
jgi:hypothetical protein